MIIFTSGTQLEIQTSTTSQVAASVTYVDMTSSAHVPGVQESLFTVVSTSGVLLSSPVTGVTRVVKEISIHNDSLVADNTILVQKNVAGTTYELTPSWRISPDTSVGYMDSQGWTFYSQVGVPAPISSLTNPPSELQSFLTAGQYFWVKPSGFQPTFVHVICYGGGGAGGCDQGNGTSTPGGTGGGGGARSCKTFLASDLPALVPVSVGPGGRKTWGKYASAGSQYAANAGSPSYFGTILDPLVIAFGGGGGYVAAGNDTQSGGAGGGTGAVGTSENLGAQNVQGGAPGTLTVGPVVAGQGGWAAFTNLTLHAEYGGAGGAGAGSSPYTGWNGYSSVHGGGGGGYGAGSAGIATSGGASNSITQGGGSAGGINSAIKTTPGGAGTSGTNGDTTRGGFGGGGGGSNTAISGVGGPGGAGGRCGGGGGGGGFSTADPTSVALQGDGGPGGDGAVYVLVW